MRIIEEIQLEQYDWAWEGWEWDDIEIWIVDIKKWIQKNSIIKFMCSTELC